LNSIRFNSSIIQLPFDCNSRSTTTDRLVGGGAGFEPETSDCPVKAAPFARECDDALMEQQRLARDARDGHELQRRICW